MESRPEVAGRPDVGVGDGDEIRDCRISDFDAGDGCVDAEEGAALATVISVTVVDALTDNQLRHQPQIQPEELPPRQAW